MAVLGYLPKLKRGQGLGFGAHFLHDSTPHQETSNGKPWTVDYGHLHSKGKAVLKGHYMEEIVQLGLSLLHCIA